MNNLLATIQTYSEKKGLIHDGARIIIGLSGGPDSVFLLHALAQFRENKNITLIAAHLDHEWRATSVQDVQFCKALAESYNIPFITKKISQLPVSFKLNGSKEELGRKSRRFFFESLAHEHDATAIALAHHADDQQETFFIRLMRGATLSGLYGMKAKDGLYIRPLLATKKSEILNYLQQNNISFLLDATNSAMDYLRNRIRLNIIPALNICDERFTKNFETTHAQLQATEDFLEHVTHNFYNETINQDGTLLIDKLFSLHPFLQKRILLKWLIAHQVSFTPSQNLLAEIIRFLKMPESKTHTFYQKWHIKKQNNAASIIV